MTATTFKVFYDTAGGFVTRWVVRDGKNENDDYSMHVEGPGETSALLPMAQYGDLNVIQARVNAMTAKNPQKKRFVTIDPQTSKIVEIVESFRAPEAKGGKVVEETTDPFALTGSTKAGLAFVPPAEFFAPKLAKWPPDPVAKEVEPGAEIKQP